MQARSRSAAPRSATSTELASRVGPLVTRNGVNEGGSTSLVMAGAQLLMQVEAMRGGTPSPFNPRVHGPIPWGPRLTCENSVRRWRAHRLRSHLTIALHDHELSHASVDRTLSHGRWRHLMGRRVLADKAYGYRAYLRRRSIAATILNRPTRFATDAAAAEPVEWQVGREAYVAGALRPN